MMLVPVLKTSMKLRLSELSRLKGLASIWEEKYYYEMKLDVAKVGLGPLVLHGLEPFQRLEQMLRFAAKGGERQNLYKGTFLPRKLVPTEQLSTAAGMIVEAYIGTILDW